MPVNYLFSNFLTKSPDLFSKNKPNWAIKINQKNKNIGNEKKFYWGTVKGYEVLKVMLV